MLNYFPAFLVLTLYQGSSETSAGLKPSQQLLVLNRQFWSGVSAHLSSALHHEGGHRLSQKFSFNGKRTAWKCFCHWDGERIASSIIRNWCCSSCLLSQKEAKIVGKDGYAQVDGKYTYTFWASLDTKNLETQEFTSKTTAASGLTHKHTEIILSVSLRQLNCRSLIPSYVYMCRYQACKFLSFQNLNIPRKLSHLFQVWSDDGMAMNHNMKNTTFPVKNVW